MKHGAKRVWFILLIALIVSGLRVRAANSSTDLYPKEHLVVTGTQAQSSSQNVRIPWEAKDEGYLRIVVAKDTPDGGYVIYLTHFTRYGNIKDSNLPWNVVDVTLTTENPCENVACPQPTLVDGEMLEAISPKASQATRNTFTKQGIINLTDRSKPGAFHWKLKIDWDIEDTAAPNLT